MADKKDNESALTEEDEVNPVKLVKCATDLQRIKLEKLMKNAEKPVFIPDRPKEKKMPTPPEFIRNAWGSSAGAGSGDFHVYRGVRRREYARQKFLTEKTKKEEQDETYHKKVEENQKLADERTAKKRAKRLKKKLNAKKKKSDSQKNKSDSEDSEGESEGDTDSQQNTADISKAKEIQT